MGGALAWGSLPVVIIAFLVWDMDLKDPILTQTEQSGAGALNVLTLEEIMATLLALGALALVGALVGGIPAVMQWYGGDWKWTLLIGFGTTMIVGVLFMFVLDPQIAVICGTTIGVSVMILIYLRAGVDSDQENWLGNGQ